MTTNLIQLKSGEVINSNAINTACFLMWGLIGDVFVRVAILEAFKQAYPHTRITSIVDPQGKVVLENHPDVAEVYVLSRKKKPRFRYLIAMLRGVRYLRGQRFDLSVNLYSGGSSPLLTRLIHARVRLGFDHTAALRKANNLLVKHPSLCKQWTKQLGTILEPLGIPASAVRQGTSYYCDQASLDFADKLFVNDDNQYVVINLGARIADKRWALSRFVALAAAIYEKYRLCPLVLTNPGMEELANEFTQQYRQYGYLRQLPLLPLNQVAAAMRHAQYVITGDTSIMHLSFGLKLPTLVLFTYTRPEIVSPIDCMHQDCFVENPEITDECGKPMGSKDIPLAMALDKFDALYQQSTGLD
jgi:ADP-heptose:LPS heptosyltransferase